MQRKPESWTNKQWADAVQWAVDNTWLSDHEDENGVLNEATYEAEIDAKVSEYIEDERWK